MGKTYYLDLNTVLTYLRNKSGTLTTSFQVSGRSCTGSISLVRGQITACIAEWSDGRRIEGNTALDQLQSSKMWQIHFDDAPPMSVQTSQPVGTHPSLPAIQQPQPLPFAPERASRIPQPTSVLFPASLIGYNAQQRIILRMVHTLVDGHRTVAQINAQLNLPPESIDTALDILSQLGMIH